MNDVKIILDVEWKFQDSVTKFVMESPENEVWWNFFPTKNFLELLTAADSQYTLH